MRARILMLAIIACHEPELRQSPDAGTQQTKPDAGRACVPGVEACNGRDDDCDGFADEWWDIPVSACWTRPGPWVGECRPGFTQCRLGKTACLGEMFPTEETCNGLDDDCDGVPDDGLNPEPIEVCAVLDTSGSMALYNPDVRAAFFAWIDSAPATVRACLVLAPPNGTSLDSAPRVELALPLSDKQTFRAVFDRSTGKDGHWFEPTIDALLWLGDGTINPGWSSERKAVVLITDEPPYAPLTGRTATEAGEALADAWIALHVFSLEPWRNQWAQAGGDFASLEDAGAMLDALRNLSQPRCR